MHKSVVFLACSLALASSAHAVPPADPGSALSFDGAGQIATVPYAPGLEFNSASTWTLEFWFFSTDIAGVRHVFGRRGNCFDNSDMVFQIAHDSNGYLAGWSGTFVSLGEIPLAQWTHVAIVSDGTSLSSYVNGTLRGLVPSGPNPQNEAPLVIGGSAPGCATFQGMIDEMRVWSTARNVNQLRYSYDCVVNPDTSSGLVADWRFDDAAASQVLRDSSPHSHNGVLGSSDQAEGNDATRVHSTVPMACALVSVDPAPSLGNAPAAVSLGAAHPNPAMFHTAIELNIRHSCDLKVEVYDVAGAPVRELRDGRFAIGQYSIHWDGLDDHQKRVGPGVYFIRAHSEHESWARPVAFVR